MRDKGSGFFSKFATWVTHQAGSTPAFIIACSVVLIWLVTGPLFKFSDTWQLVINTGTTIVTFLMVFLIQNSQNRDAAAMQAKLDELIRAIEQARGQFIGIEHLTDSEIERIREALELEQIEIENGKSATTGQTVERLLRRR